MGDFVDLTGQKFGRFIVIKRLENNKFHKATFLCLCECGNERVVVSGSLKSGNSKSCGCLSIEKPSRLKHGKSKSSVYIAWTGILDRCTNPNIHSFSHYGGRNITVCDRWKESFENFYEDMGEKPSPNHSIDRIDVNGNYEPSNCRWANKKDQAINQRIRKDNTSGIRGVTWDKSRNMWSATIGNNNKLIRIGHFNDLSDAITARKEAELKYWGKSS